MYAGCHSRVQLDLQVTTESHYSRKIYSMIAALKKKTTLFSLLDCHRGTMNSFKWYFF